MPVNTYAGLPPQQRQFYDRTLIERLKADLVFAMHGQKRPVPKNKGDMVQFRKFNSLAPALTPLTEGATPIGDTLNITTITAKANQYGNYVQTSDVLNTAGIDPVFTETVDLIGENASETLDIICRNGISVGTNVLYANGKLSRSALVAADVISSNDIFKARRTLKSANVPAYSKDAYLGIISPAVAFDLMKDPLWQDVSKYNGGKAIIKGEIGTLGGVRFIETSNIEEINNGSTDVHLCYIFGKDAYGVVDIAGKATPEIITKELGAGEDPLNQRASAGWKALFVSKILNEESIVRFEVAVSA
jgi:Phage capsid family.